MSIILMAGAILSGISKHLIDVIAILMLVFANVSITFVQKMDARESLESLREIGAPQATVVREGHLTRLVICDIFPGDIIKLSIGDMASAITHTR